METIEPKRIGDLDVLYHFEVEDLEFLAYLALLGVLTVKIPNESKTELPENLVGVIVPPNKNKMAAIYSNETDLRRI